MYRLKKLKNGINLITVPETGVKSATLLAMFPVGSRYESKDISGASHFVEHMMFKGTNKRTNYLDISRELDSVGAEYNAFTSKDYTAYYIKISSENLVLACDMLSDIIYNSNFDEQEVEKEKGVIVEEIRMYEDNPMTAVDLQYDKLTFGDHPLGWDIAGTSHSVRSISRNHLFNYYTHHYTPENMVLVAAGDVNNDQFVRGLKYFSAIRPKKKNTSKYKKYSWNKTRVALQDRVAVSERKVDQAQVILGFPGLPHEHPDKYAAAILLTVLGSGMSSRLFVEVREKRGLAYMVHSGGASFRDVGVATIQAGLDPNRLGDAFTVIKDELEKIKKEPITAKELESAKNYISGHTALSMEDSSSQAQWYARQFLFNSRVETQEQFIKNLKRVKIEEVTKMARRFFDFDRMTVSVVGPMSKKAVLGSLNK